MMTEQQVNDANAERVRLALELYEVEAFTELPRSVQYALQEAMRLDWVKWKETRG